MRSLSPARILLVASAVFCASQAAPERPAGQRGLASCVSEEVAGFPMPGDLISQIQDSALRNSARDFYFYLTQVELSALQGRETIFRHYGAGSIAAPTAAKTMSLYQMPTVAPFPFQSAPSTSSAGIGFWGNFTIPTAAIATATTTPAAVQARVPFASAPAASPFSIASLAAAPTTVSTPTATITISTAQKAPASVSLPRVVNIPPTFTPYGGR